ncbi:MAG: hypothetical protein JWR77_948 [Rhizorhabdus sp.]|nr:hypothetical protein [Rhizorhabdus sp.]
MPKLSTARESLARLNARIEAQADPVHRAWLTVYRDHWWGEVIGDVDAVMATMSHGPISYSFDGHPFMVPDGGIAAVESYDDTRLMYEGVVALGVKMAGPIDGERIAIDEHGIIIYCTLTTIYPGVYLTKHKEPVDPDALYLVRWPNITMIKFDADGLMMGEDIVNGAPILVQKVDRSQVDSLIDGPLVAA